MAEKQILFSEQARRKLLKGMEKGYKAVKATLGPKARYTVVDKGFGAPDISDDGVSIIKEIELADKVENLGVEILKEVAEKTSDKAGDGTTTSMVLAFEIAKEGLKNVAAGAVPLLLRKGIEKGLERVVEFLKKNSKTITKKEEIANVAQIASLDPEVGKIIAETISEIGKDGVITVEESKKFGLEREIVKGLQFDRGYVSPYMITNLEKMEAVLEEPYILITDKKISALNEILPILEKVVQTGKKDLLIIADELEGDALATLIVNKIRGVLNCVAVKAPGFGDRKKEMLQDIAIVTGGQVISEELGLKLENIKLDYLGRARRVVVEKERTTIVEGKGKKEEIDARIKQLKEEVQRTESDFDKEKLQERIAKLSGGVAVIKVGAATEIEQKTKQKKTENALNATRAAIEEGILPGGGIALLKAQSSLEELEKTLQGDEKTGVLILKKALEVPIKQISENAGFDSSIVIQKVKENKDFAFGFNSLAGKFENLLESGVIDATKVIRTALENAVSAASMLFVTECVVSEIPEKKKKETELPEEDY